MIDCSLDLHIVFVSRSAFATKILRFQMLLVTILILLYYTLFSIKKRFRDSFFVFPSYVY